MKQKLLLALLVLFTLGGSNLFAQTDVTSTYLTNADFSQSTAIDNHVCGYSADMSKNGTTYCNMQAVDGWEFGVANGDTKGGAVFAYGSTPQLKGNNVAAPSAGPNGEEGNCLGLFAVWTGTVQYVQAVTLPAGKYKISIPVYSQSGSEANKSLMGFIADNGTTYTVNAVPTAGSWITETVEFTLAVETSGKISLGYVANNVGSSKSPHLFIDGVKIEYTDPLQTAKEALQAEIDKAKLCDAKEGLADAIAAAEAALASATTEQELAEALATLQAADKDAVLRYENNLADASATNGLLTEFVVNGTFTDNVSGWTATGGFQNSAKASNQSGDFTVPFWENWNGSAKVNKMYQTISNIPNGTYKLKIAAFVNTLADPNVSQYVFANDDKTYLTTGDPTFYEVWTVVTDNTVEIGLEQTTATANWMGIDNVSLTYYGAGDVISQAQAGAHKTDWEEALAAAKAAVANTDYENVTGKELVDLNTEIAKDEPTTAEGYDEAAAALRSATQAFIAAKDNYDALVAEIAKAEALGVENADDYAATSETTAATALTNTQNLKVAEYNYVTTIYQYGVDLGEWTSTGTNTKAADFSNEHWSGTNHKYKNQDDSNGQGWNASSWSINFSQDVILPAGNYVFKVAGRQATGNQVNTSLVVKVGDTELGSVSDFPRGNSARGIDTNGATNFSDDGTYANNGNGFGWEWRYVKFTLTEEATVNIAINSVATAKYQWVSFGDYTVQTDNEANISMIAYNIALNDAKAAQTNEDYAHVTGKEKTALDEAIAADETLDKTDKEAIEAATTALTNATSAFTAAKAAYDAFVAAKAAETPELEYAATSKKDALTTAKAAEDATSASDAETKTAAITTALRLYYESHALAEGVTGATQITISDPDMNVEYNSTDHTFGAWQVFGQTDGTISLKTESDEPLTDSDGNKYKYADIWKSDNNGGIKQSVTLAPGKYMLTAAARAQDTNGATFGLFAGTERIEIPRISNTGGVFGNGWNDVSVEFYVTTQSNVEIGVQSGNGKTMWWGATRFRLVKFPTEEVTLDDAATEAPAKAYANVTYERKLAAGYNSLVLPFEVTREEIGGNAVEEIYEYKGCTVTGEGDDAVYHLDFQKGVETLAANTPYLVKMKEEKTGLSFEGKTIAPAVAEVANDNFSFVGTYVAFAKDAENNPIVAGDYISVAAGLKKASGGNKLNAFRAYLKNNTGTTNANVKINVNGEEVDAITAIEINNALNDGIYNLQGQKVNAALKGIYIVNGKKIVVK